MSVRVESGQATLERTGGKSGRPLLIAARQPSISTQLFGGLGGAPEGERSLSVRADGSALFFAL